MTLYLCGELLEQRARKPEIVLVFLGPWACKTGRVI